MPDRIATDLLRIARDPATGRLKHRSALDTSLRTALLAELVLRGRIVDVGNAPSVASTEPTGDRILDAVRAAVEKREGVTWRRWFSHVSGDRKALSNELVRAGRWRTGPGLRTSYVDAEQDQALAMSLEVGRVVRLERAPAEPREAVLAVLAACCGAAGSWPRPGAVKRDLKPVVAAVDDDTVAKLLGIAARVMRRARRGRSMV